MLLKAIHWEDYVLAVLSAVFDMRYFPTDLRSKTSSGRMTCGPIPENNDSLSNAAFLSALPSKEPMLIHT